MAIICVSTPVKPPPKQVLSYSSLDPELRHGHRLKFERRITILSMLAGFPAVFCALFCSGTTAIPPRCSGPSICCSSCCGSASPSISRPASSVRCKHFQHSCRHPRRRLLDSRARALTGDALGEVMLEVNDLGQTLREQRLGAMEATALLRTVMARSTSRSLPSTASNGCNSSIAPVNDCWPNHRHVCSVAPPKSSTPRLVSTRLARRRKRCRWCFRAAGRWDIRRSTFREGGAQHQLLVLTDLSRASRRGTHCVAATVARSWPRAEQLAGADQIGGGKFGRLDGQGTGAAGLARRHAPRGLAVISSRADSLARFVESYSKLARLPPPRLEPLKIGALVSRVASLETRLPVNVVSGPDVVVQGDDVQLEQLLINLVRNAVDASMETRGKVDVGWQQKNGQVEVWVRDEGRDSPAPRTSSCRSLRRRRRDRELAWCCRGRLPKRTEVR